MALVDLNPMFDRTRGRLGNIVHYNRMGTQCARRFVVPRNPDTAAQRAIRGSFRDAVHAWQALPDAEKALWNFRTRYKAMSGYNLFVSRFMKGACNAVSEGSYAVPAAFSSGPSSIQFRFPSVSAGHQMALHNDDRGFTHAGPGKG